MNTASKKIIAKNVLCLAAGLVLNRVIDAQLAKSENPGRFNRWYRRQLKSSLYLTPVFTGIATALEVSISENLNSQVTWRQPFVVYDAATVPDNDDAVIAG